MAQSPSQPKAKRLEALFCWLMITYQEVIGTLAVSWRLLLEVLEVYSGPDGMVGVFLYLACPASISFFSSYGRPSIIYYYLV